MQMKTTASPGPAQNQTRKRLSANTDVVRDNLIAVWDHSRNADIMMTIVAKSEIL